MSTALGEGVLGGGILGGDTTPPADGLEVTVESPNGATATTRPTVRWSHTPPSSVQVQYQVNIIEGSDTVFTTGWVVGTQTEFTIPNPLNAGASYTARVHVLTDFPSSAFGQSTFLIETPDLRDSVSRPFLLHTATLFQPRRAQE